MISIALATLAVVSAWTNDIMTDDFNFTGGIQTLESQAIFRITQGTIDKGGEIVPSLYSDYNTIAFTNVYNINEYTYNNVENGFSITQKMYISTNNVDYELIDVATFSEYDVLTSYGSMYQKITLTTTTNEYYDTLQQYVGSYVKFELTLSFENIVMDSDMNIYPFNRMYTGFIRPVNAIKNYNGQYDRGYTDGYKTGESEGYTDGYEDGETTGYNNGYQDATERAEETSGYTIQSMIFSILDYPLKLVKDVTNVELFGVNLYSVITFALTITLVAFVVKYFI